MIPPHIAQLTGEDHLEFLTGFFENLKSYREYHPVMGFLPFVAPIEFRKLLNFYFNLGITCYAMDFEGKNPIDSYLLVNELHRFSRLIEKEYQEDTFLHAFNVPLTKVQPKTEVGIAKDIITFTIGFDSFGTSHISKMKPEVAEKLRNNKKGKPRLDMSYRVFNRNDYGYYRADSAGIEQHLREEAPTSIQFGHLNDRNASQDKLTSLRKAFNVERHALEAVELRDKIKENVVLQHLEHKSYAKDTLNLIKKRIV